MDLEQLREYTLSKPDAEETFPFGPDTLVYKIHGKMFLLTGFDSIPLQFNVKCDPDLALELREQYAAVIPGWHMNKKHWNTVIIDGSISNKELQKMIDHSYELVRGKKNLVKR
ncbi:MAG: MmcQ/YjbR family DNA-binding protein [Chitinophagaceae bacterium]|nr:MmcQ/YjbR family DNA-binding protein [Chitinophagaceae bacterium]